MYDDLHALGSHRRARLRLPWAELHADLDDRGFAQTPVVLSPRECSELSGLYPSGSFRSTIAMARHRFGEGEYKYFDRRLPEPIQELRTSFYGPLAEAANRWARRLGEDVYGEAASPFQIVTVLDRPTRTSRAASSCLSSSAPARRAARTSAGCAAARSSSR